MAATALTAVVAPSGAEPPAEVAGLRDLATSPPPTEESERPSPADWKDAEDVALAGPLPEGCRARLLREWLRLSCDYAHPQALSILSGDTRGVSAYLRSEKQLWGDHGHQERHDGVTLIELPLRRGDRRVMELTVAIPADYEGFWADGELIISEQWLAGQEGPWVTVTMR